MTAGQERLASLEGRADEYSNMTDLIREQVSGLERRTERQFDKIDARFDRVDARFDKVEARFDKVDAKFERLDDRISRQFMWLVGIQVTTLAAVVGAIAAIAATLRH